MPRRGFLFNDAETLIAIQENLLPQVSITTPNHAELKAMTNTENTELTNARTLCERGAEYVLVTGGDTNTQEVSNTLYNHTGVVHESHWPRLKHSFHGSGCTLSSALACYLAQGLNAIEATQKAQQYTWQTLQKAQALGKGQHIPTRL